MKNRNKQTRFTPLQHHRKLLSKTVRFRDDFLFTMTKAEIWNHKGTKIHYEIQEAFLAF